MYTGIKQYNKLGILMFVLIFINDKIFAFGNSYNENRRNLSRTKECTVLCEELNLNSKSYLIYFKNTMNATEQKFKNFELLLSESIHINKTNNTSEKMNGVHKTKDLKINFVNCCETSNSMKLTKTNMTVVSRAACRNLISLVNNVSRTLKKFRKICGPQIKTCHEKKQIKISEQPSANCTDGKWRPGYNSTLWPNVIKRRNLFQKIIKFNIINEEPGYIDIGLSEDLNPVEVFLWYASYANTTTPRFECSKILRQNFTLHVTPNVNYLICLATTDKYFYVNVFDCQPFKTKPLRENQPLLVKKSIPTLIISLSALFILAMAMGASVLYLSVHKNPSLIRGGKRVIEVKRQDKTHILIMPRGYENLPQDDNSLALSLGNDAVEPAISTLSYDTNSTISYVSANQPTPVEMLTYRLNRLRELFYSNNINNNNIPQLVSSIPMSFSMSLNQRLPPNVDLLFEYEWYTITTTIITTTTSEDE